LQHFPEEIEVDLLERGIDIADWWNKTVDGEGRRVLSSRRLLTILKFLPPTSNFQNAYRDDWTDDRYLAVALVNELRSLRVDQAALSGHEMEMVPIKSPRQQESEQAEIEEKHRIRAGIIAQLTDLSETE